MTYPAAEQSVTSEVRHFIEQRKILMLSTLDSSGEPYASCAPFAVAGDVFYVPLNGIAARAVNLQVDPPPAMVLLIEDDSEGRDQAVRTRAIYQVTPQLVSFDDNRWDEGIAVLAQRHGDRLLSLSQFNDFRLFRLTTIRGRFITGSGKAYALGNASLAGVITRALHCPTDRRSTTTHGKRSAA
ncbi:MAG: pyridoxamine 5'-phosphate oxidase family protein [Bacteroidales bacterium]|nr:pyridoxamine 5'-phosphate oxidase family protein [Bacteroidales bacterium]